MVGASGGPGRQLRPIRRHGPRADPARPIYHHEIHGVFLGGPQRPPLQDGLGRRRGGFRYLGRQGLPPAVQLSPAGEADGASSREDGGVSLFRAQRDRHACGYLASRRPQRGELPKNPYHQRRAAQACLQNGNELGLGQRQLVRQLAAPRRSERNVHCHGRMRRRAVHHQARDGDVYGQVASMHRALST